MPFDSPQPSASSSDDPPRLLDHTKALILSPTERAAFDHIAGIADRTLSRLTYAERRRVWGHLARLCGDLVAG